MLGIRWTSRYVRVHCFPTSRRTQDLQDAVSRFTLDSATEFLFGKRVHSLPADPAYPHNVSPIGNSVDNSKIADDFAREFADTLYTASQRACRSRSWPLFKLWGDKTVEPMKVVNAYIEPIPKDAIEKAKDGSPARGEADPRFLRRGHTSRPPRSTCDW